MGFLVHHLLQRAAASTPAAAALRFGDRALSYGELWDLTCRTAAGLRERGLRRRDRVAVFLEKRIEKVVAVFGTTAAGGVSVPLNPVLRPAQVAHILGDCDVRFLVTSPERFALLRDALHGLPALETIVLVGHAGAPDAGICSWDDLVPEAAGEVTCDAVDADMAAILYTSGSTGMPKGVVLSHRNLVAGGRHVSDYLGNRPDDRILSVLPLSFDAGLSQLTTAFTVGAEVVLLNYLLARDVVRACARHRITGLTCVPPLCFKLVQEEWPDAARHSLRYFANTGGHMPKPTLDALRSIFPAAKPFLMYGLTEAFRSTYLDPSEVDARPDSIGKAIPNAEILVIGEDGEECAPGEVGELVHRGVLVAMGYWNDPELTAKRFRPAPGQPAGIPIPELAVWSGDLVRKDEDGFLYFVGRNDDMIKTSGYRVSPTEIEEAVLQTGLAREAVALGVPHDELGQTILVVAVPPEGSALDIDGIVAACRARLPLYMVPFEIRAAAELPRNANGKIDRRRVKDEVLGTR